MDIFVRGVPQQASEANLREFFRPRLSALHCCAYHVAKPKNKTFCTLKLPNTFVGNAFLALYGEGAHPATKAPLTYLHAPLKCSESRHKSDPFVLRSLQNEQNKTPTRTGVSARPTNKFAVNAIRCGFLYIGRKALAIVLHSEAGTENSGITRIDISYHTVDSVAFSSVSSASMTLTLYEAPRFSGFAWDKSLSDLLQQLNLTSQPKRIRNTSLDPTHAAAAGSCLVYRLRSADHSLRHIQQALKAIEGSPSQITWPTSSRSASKDFHAEMRSFMTALTSHTEIPFKIRYHIQRLAQNGYLRPQQVLAMLPSFQTLAGKYLDVALAESIGSVTKDIPYAGPDTDPVLLSEATILKLIDKKAQSFKYAGSIWDQAQRQSHLGVIHRVVITPAGMYLDRPQLEVKNRILRKYSLHCDDFVRVSFQDENGDYVAWMPDPKDAIFREKFKDVLSTSVNIAGRQYTFLGFSHSSLGSNQCWMMAPFTQSGTLIFAQMVIDGIGDFSAIRSPAKCAARIGQAFSDATHTIQLHPRQVGTTPDVQRGSRVFTDGVGTISQGLLRRVWKEFAHTRKKQATVLQIRFRGAKGVLALDKTLPGEQLYLRESMVKFPGSEEDMNLEICGAAYRPLPFYLNKSCIKILEDQGVDAAVFLRLQKKAIDNLQRISSSPINAANFLEANSVTAISASSLISSLAELGLDYRRDEFLRGLVEVSTLVQLREIKHRARIPVPNAYTLYGISDETGFLREGEVFVRIRDSTNCKTTLTGDIMITRSPAHAPGDVRTAKAVDVPESSPLQYLYNCVVFSQHGERDLPSMLSGGDLDGDLYNVVFDPDLRPKIVPAPADYARPAAIDIGRTVTRQDMTDWMIQYMENDKLGYIANLWMQCADQEENGSFSAACVKLAELASTAVDFSKTGIVVPMNEVPKLKSKFCKPDFMSPAPRLLMNAHGMSLEDAISVVQATDDDGDAVIALDPERTKIMWYESEKVLGKLYRAIDEQKFLREVRTDVMASSSAVSVMQVLRDYVRRKTLGFQWEQYRPFALEVRDTYNENIVEAAFNWTPDPRQPLTEVELAAGVVLGRSGDQFGRRARETSQSMKETFDRAANFTIEHILKGDSDLVEPYVDADFDDEDDDDLCSEGLERSIACFLVAMDEDVEPVRRFGTPKSFRYLTAAVCSRCIKRRFRMVQLR